MVLRKQVEKALTASMRGQVARLTALTLGRDGKGIYASIWLFMEISLVMINMLRSSSISEYDGL